MLTLLENQTENGGSDTFIVFAPAQLSESLMVASGTFDGASVTVSVRVEDTDDWVVIDPVEGVFQDAGAVVVALGYVQIKAELTGAGASTDVTLRIVASGDTV